MARHVAEHPGLFGGGPLPLAGDSAGGNLAASVALALHDDGTPAAAQLLAYPAVDLSKEPNYPSLADNVHGSMLTASDLDNSLNAYINNDPALAKPPGPHCGPTITAVWRRPSSASATTTPCATRPWPTPTSCARPE